MLSLRRPAQSASGAALVVVGLVAPATSLAGGTREGGGGSITAALIRLGATEAFALVVLSPGQSTRRSSGGRRCRRRSSRPPRRPDRVCRGTHPRLCAWDRRAPGRLSERGSPHRCRAVAATSRRTRPRYGSARSSSARAAQRVGARPVGHGRAFQEERANVLDIRRSWLVWPYLVDRAQDHFAVWEVVIAIEQREDRPIEAHSVGRGQQVDKARQVQRTVCPGPPARVGHVRASRAPTSLKRRCVEPQQRAGGKLSRPRVPLAGSCRPPTGFDQSRGRRAVAETCQPTAPPLVLA